MDLMSNFDHKIDREVEARVRAGEQADYPAWDFHGTVTFDKERKLFVCVVRRFGRHVGTVEAETCEGIMEECCERFGHY